MIILLIILILNDNKNNSNTFIKNSTNNFEISKQVFELRGIEPYGNYSYFCLF